MSPFIYIVVCLLAILFIILGLAPFVDGLSDVTDLTESNRTKHSQM